MRLQLKVAALHLGAASTWLAACVGDPPLAEPPAVDRARFERDVYPILLRDCGFVACHGNPSRFFRVYGPGRTRLDPITERYAPPTVAELEASFDRARSMLSGAPEPRLALLVRKPLEPAAGGAGHMGTDALGRNVYASTDDPSWRAIAAWAGVALAGPDAGGIDATTPEAGIDGSAPDARVRDAAEDAP